MLLCSACGVKLTFLKGNPELPQKSEVVDVLLWWIRCVVVM